MALDAVGHIMEISLVKTRVVANYLDQLGCDWTIEGLATNQAVARSNRAGRAIFPIRIKRLQVTL